MRRVISTRPERPGDDDDFVRAVYASTRQPELAVLRWPAAEQVAFVRMQFEAQARHYRTAFPDASHSIVCVDGRPAGRLIVHRSDDEIRIVDIALLPEFRRAGVGRELISRLLTEADATALPVRLHVLAGSEARRFWEQAGFAARGTDDDGVYLSMERPCPTSLR
jgi:GNAT superfamily N-acetyltransferase